MVNYRSILVGVRQGQIFHCFWCIILPNICCASKCADRGRTIRSTVSWVHLHRRAELGTFTGSQPLTQTQRAVCLICNFQVGHLAKSREPPFLVHNYSRSGQTAEGVRTQAFVEFTQRHPPEIPWTAHDTVFATWVGINDLTVTSDVQPRIDALFEAQQRLYEQGARIFLFVDLFPPAPASNEVEPEYRDRFSRWNVALDRAIRAFSAEKSTAADPITVIYFSSHKVFSAIISNPTAYGFSERDTKKAGGLIWEDRMHPTSAGHLVVAKELNEVLSSIPPCSSQSSD